MGINSETDQVGEMQIGPTSTGMVRIFVAGHGFELPMDFTPAEAEEIAQEIMDAATLARGAKADKKPKDHARSANDDKTGGRKTGGSSKKRRPKGSSA